MTLRILKLTAIAFTILLCPCSKLGEPASAFNNFTSQQMDTARSLRQAALKGSGAYDILSDLVKTAPKRLAGSAGDRNAVAWAEAKFRELGFDRVWTEPVKLQGWARR